MTNVKREPLIVETPSVLSRVLAQTEREAKARQDLQAVTADDAVERKALIADGTHDILRDFSTSSHPKTSQKPRSSPVPRAERANRQRP